MHPGGLTRDEVRSWLSEAEKMSDVFIRPVKMGADLRVSVIAELTNHQTVQLPRGHGILSTHLTEGRPGRCRKYSPLRFFWLLDKASLFVR